MVRRTAKKHAGEKRGRGNISLGATYCVRGLLSCDVESSPGAWRGRPARHARMCRESEPFVTLLSQIEMQPPRRSVVFLL